VLSHRNDDRHHELRTKIAAGVCLSGLHLGVIDRGLQYAGKKIEDLEEMMDRNVSAFIHLIDSKYASSDSRSKESLKESYRFDFYIQE
jgi:hypothetical protein